MKTASTLFSIAFALVIAAAPMVTDSNGAAYATAAAKSPPATDSGIAYGEANFETSPPCMPAAAGVAPQAPSSRRCPQCGFCFANSDRPPRGDRPHMTGRGGRGGRPHMGRHGRPGPCLERNRGGGAADRGRGMAAGKILRHAEELELDGQQVSQLEELALNARKDMVDLRAAIEKERLQLEEQMRLDSDDIATIRKHLNTLAQKRVDVQEYKLRNWIAVKKILSDEQKKMIKDKRPRLGGFLD